MKSLPRKFAVAGFTLIDASADATRMQRRERELLESFAATEAESTARPVADPTEAVT